MRLRLRLGRVRVRVRPHPEALANETRLVHVLRGAMLLPGNLSDGLVVGRVLVGVLLRAWEHQHVELVA